MIFMFGPLWSGKRSIACKILKCKADELSQYAVWDVQERVSENADLEKLAIELSRCQVVIATEVGGGVVPVDAAERTARERAGRLNCLLAERADTVIRVFCGIPMVIKGELP